MENKTFGGIRETQVSCTLPNGLAIRVFPQPGYVRSFALFATRYGGAMRRFTLDGELRDTPAGVAHFLEHKMFDMPSGDALTEMSRRGASPNAFTAGGVTAYHFEATRDFEENLRTLLTFVSTPYFTEESVRKEQGIIGQEVRMYEDSPDECVYYGLMRLLYAANPVRDPVVGTVESIAQITPDVLYRCHKAFYSPSNMALCAAGDVDPETIRAAAEALLPAERASVPQPDFGPEDTAAPGGARTERTMPVSAPQFLLGSRVKPAPAGAALLRQKLAGETALRCLLGRSSPFFTGLYAEGLLKNDFSAAVDYSAGTATLLAGGESAEPLRVLERLSARAAEVAERGLPADAFERARRAVYGDRLRALESFDELCYDAALGCFGGYDALSAFETLWSLTADECAAFLTEYLAPEALALSVVTPPKG